MKYRTCMAALVAGILTLAVLLSFGACGKKDAIEETRQILAAADNFTFIYTIDGRNSNDMIALPYQLLVTPDAVSEESSFGTTYALLGADEVTVWEPAGGDAYVPSKHYTRAEYDAMTLGADSVYGMFLSYLRRDAWKWDRRRDAFVPRDLTMFDHLGMEVLDMELAITGATCTIMGRAIKTENTRRYEVLLTMAVIGIGGTEITLPDGVIAD